MSMRRAMCGAPTARRTTDRGSATPLGARAGSHAPPRSPLFPAAASGYRATVEPRGRAEELHRVAEQPQPVAFGLQPVARPVRVLRRQDVPLRVRHQAQHAAGRVAEPGHVALRAVRVDRVAARLALRIDVAQHDLAGLFQPATIHSLRQTNFPSPWPTGTCSRSKPFRNGHFPGVACR